VPLTVRTSFESAGGGGGGGRGGTKGNIFRGPGAGGGAHTNADHSNANGRSIDADTDPASIAKLGKRRDAYRKFPGKFEVRCKIEGCVVACDKPYSARIKVCAVHTKMAQVSMDGVISRFCHKCNKLHYLTAFEGTGHTCNAWLIRLRDEYHKQGKRKKRKPSSLGANMKVYTGGTDEADGGSHPNAASNNSATSVANTRINSGDRKRASAGADDSDWARINEVTAALFSERSNSTSSTLDHRKNGSFKDLSSQQLEDPEKELDLDLFGDDFGYILENVVEQHPQQHQNHLEPAVDDAFFAATLHPPGQLSDLERPPAAPSHGAAAGNLEQRQSMILLSFWVKLHGFIPAQLPPGGLREILAHWMQSRYEALSCSVQPGCTLLMFDCLLPEGAVASWRERGVSGLAAMVSEGPLGARGDFAVGFDRDVAEAKETHGEGRNFEILTSSTNAAGDAQTSSPVSAVLLASGLQVLSDLCVCSSGEEGDTTVIVRLPCPLPEGGRVECRARGRIVPVPVAKMSYGPDGGVTAHVVMPPTGLDGAALLEMVHGDGITCGVPAAVLVLATDALLAATINAVGQFVFYVDQIVRNPFVSTVYTFELDELCLVSRILFQAYHLSIPLPLPRGSGVFSRSCHSCSALQHSVVRARSCDIRADVARAVACVAQVGAPPRKRISSCGASTPCESSAESGRGSDRSSHCGADPERCIGASSARLHRGEEQGSYEVCLDLVRVVTLSKLAVPTSAFVKSSKIPKPSS
jgi:hypothetical protein